MAGEYITFEWTTSRTIIEITWGIKKTNLQLIETSLIYVTGSNTVKILNSGTGEPGESYKERISFTGDLTQKKGAFKITNVQLSDSVLYGCEILEPGQLLYTFEWAELVVVGKYKLFINLQNTKDSHIIV